MDGFSGEVHFLTNRMEKVNNKEVVQKPKILAGMLEKHPLWNEHWEENRAKIEKIQVLAYILASYSTGLHTEGSVRCYEEVQIAKQYVPNKQHDKKGSELS